MALLNSSPVIETSKLVTTEVSSRSQTPSLRSRRCIDVACRLCTHYVDNLYHIHYERCHRATAATGDMVKFSYINTCFFNFHSSSIKYENCIVGPLKIFCYINTVKVLITVPKK